MRKYALKPAQGLVNKGSKRAIFFLKREQVQEVPSGFDRSHEERQRGETRGGKTEQPAV